MRFVRDGPVALPRALARCALLGFAVDGVTRAGRAELLPLELADVVTLLGGLVVACAAYGAGKAHFDAIATASHFVVEPTTRLELVTSSLPRKCSTTELGGQGACSLPGGSWRRSGRPGSNRRRSAWKADALPTELLPQRSEFQGKGEKEVPESGLCGGDRTECGVDRTGTLRVPGWRVMDSNHRRHSRQIYSLLPLATRATLRIFTLILRLIGPFDGAFERWRRAAGRASEGT